MKFNRIRIVNSIKGKSDNFYFVIFRSYFIPRVETLSWKVAKTFLKHRGEVFLNLRGYIFFKHLVYFWNVLGRYSGSLANNYFGNILSYKSWYVVDKYTRKVVNKKVLEKFLKCPEYVSWKVVDTLEISLTGIPENFRILIYGISWIRIFKTFRIRILEASWMQILNSRKLFCTQIMTNVGINNGCNKTCISTNNLAIK